MQIFIDADACPAAIKVKLKDLALRTRIPLTLLAGPLLLARLSDGDLVVTADRELAAAAIDKGATALDPGAGAVVGGALAPLAQRDHPEFTAALDAWLALRTGRSGHGPDQQ
jgi:uncharacterized protein YaiI (UPF0178 family)